MARAISFFVLLMGAALFVGIAVFAHLDFNEYHQRDCFVDNVSNLNGSTTTLHYFFWDEDGVERLYQDQAISPSAAGQYQKDDEFKCLFYKDDKQFITLSQFYLDFWLLLLSIALMTLGCVIVISRLLGARQHFE